MRCKGLKELKRTVFTGDIKPVNTVLVFVMPDYQRVLEVV